MFETVLVANRGEIAVRVIRTLRRLGIRSAAVFSDADADARHVAEADVAYRLGPAPARESYLSIERVVAACRATGAQAVHPGYGFLSENGDFAARLLQEGIVFIGPPVSAIRVMGDKITAKNTVTSFDVPVVPGIAEPGLSDAALIGAAPGIGFPVLVKPSAGGGGKGMRVVERAVDLPDALVSARREARSSFGDDTLFLERYVQRPRHIEVQVLADTHGNVIHLGERECSLQRRHQKVIEEAPSPLIDQATRERIGAAACATARSVGYQGAGTVEFIVSADRPDEFFFMEMNTRLQVEHPVTEAVTGVDLVEWQIRVAAGDTLELDQDDVVLSGHAFEARVYAEDPEREFLPTGGRVLRLREPRGHGVRVDSGLLEDTVVGSDYDPMLFKVIASGPDRSTALLRLDRALADTTVLGVTTNIAFLRHLTAHSDVRAGTLDTTLLDRIAAQRGSLPPSTPHLLAGAAHDWCRAWAATGAHDLWSAPTGWRVGDHQPLTSRFQSAEGTAEVVLAGAPGGTVHATVLCPGAASPTEHRLSITSGDGELRIDLDGILHRAHVADDGDAVWVHIDGATRRLSRAPRRRSRADEAVASNAQVTSPLPGTVLAVHVTDGQRVSAGDPVLVVEAMKMEHGLRAPVDGVIQVLVAVGTQVRLDQTLARIARPTGEEDPA